MATNEQDSVRQGNSLDPKVLEAVRTIAEALSGLTNKQSQQALAMVTSLRNLRVVPMDRPIGNNQPAVKKTTGESSSGKSSPRASWKQNAQWSAAQQQRNELVAAVKSSSSEADRLLLVEELHAFEERMKALKQSLRGSTA